MPKISSNDYHDYFIKDGKLIGEFEQMYQNVEDPWNLDKTGKRIDQRAAIFLAQWAVKKDPKILDLGCGKGLFTSWISEAVGGKIYASDVSPTAIAQARERYKNLNIEWSAFDLNEAEKLPQPKHSFDLIVLSQVLWCFIPKVHHVLSTLKDFLAPDGQLFMAQHFFNGPAQQGQQRYGADVAGKPEDLVRILKETGWELTATIESGRFVDPHHLMLLAKPASAKKG